VTAAQASLGTVSKTVSKRPLGAETPTMTQPLTAFHATVRTARKKGGFKAGLRRRDESGLERGQAAPRHLHDRAASSPIGSGCCSS
jgi:hypothetical protein